MGSLFKWEVFSNANDIYFFLIIFPHEPPLQASPSAIPRISIWSILQHFQVRGYSFHFTPPLTGKKTMCNSRKYPYLPHGRDFFQDPPPFWKFQLSFIHFFKFFGLTEPPTPQETSIPSVGGVWIFSGTAQFSFFPLS